MSNDRRQVLEMLAAGKISAEDAERLIEKLATSSDAASAAGTQPKGARPKYLRVVVTDSGDKVNIRVPLALVRTGIKLSTMLPSEANERLSERGIDLSQLSGLQGEELIDALRDLHVDVDAEGGETVRIFCE